MGMGEWGSGEVGGEADLDLGADFSGVAGAGSSKCFLTRMSMSSREKWDLRR
jgi:hypothetical protein